VGGGVGAPPPAVLSFLFQQQFIEGPTAGAVKQ